MWDFLDRLNDGIIILSEDRRIKYINRSAFSFLGVKEGDYVTAILKDDDKGVFLDNVITVAKRGDSYSNFMRFFDKNGNLLLGWLNVFKWKDYFVFEIFDLTPVNTRSDDITDSSYTKILKYMSVGISHSIRNPIMSAGGMLGRIKARIKELDSKESEKLIRYIEIVEKSLYRIISIIANIEVVSNSLPVKLERLDVGGVVKTVVDRYKRNVEFVVQVRDEVYVYADKMHIGFVLEEVIKNSLDALEGVDKPIIEISVFKKDRYAIVEIADNGRGMSKEELSLTTIPFYSSKPSNMGIGLSLAKFIIEGYHGSISIESKEGEGTKVTISIPIEKRSNIRVRKISD